MSVTPAAIRIAQTIGITSATFAAGGTLCITYYDAPSLLLSPYPLVVKQWKKAFDIGKFVHPGLAVVSVVAYGYLAYALKGTLDQHKAELYAVSALTSLMWFPWTLLVIQPTNNKLFAKLDDIQALQGKDVDQKVTEVGTPKGESSHELISYWSNLNVVRGLLVLAAGILGTWTSLN